MEIWLGQAGSGKTAAVCQAAANAQENLPEGPPIYVLTPDQATFVVEKKMLGFTSEGVLVRTQVHHFRRLALLVLKAHNQLPRSIISPAGKYALFTDCLQEVQGDLKVFARSLHDFCYQERLLALIEEFQESGLRAELGDRIKNAALTPRLRAKLQDLARLWQRYEEKITGRFMDPYHLLPEFVKFVRAHPAEVRKWSVYVDGFLGFTGQEWEAIAALAKHAGNFVITVGLPPEWAELSEMELAARTEFSPYAQAVEVFGKCKEMAARLGLQLLVKAPPGYRKGARFLAPALNYLEGCAFAAAPGPFELTDDAQEPGLRMVAATTKAEEVAGMVRDLLRQKAEHGYRFKDFAVIVTDFASYRQAVVRQLREAGIPYTMDERTPLMFHPLPKLVLGLLGWMNQDDKAALELLKSDLFILQREEADELENILLAAGLTLSEWLDVNIAPEHRGRVSVQKRLRQLRAAWVPVLEKGVLPARRWLRQLWETLAGLGVEKRLENTPVERQVYQLTMRIFDDLAAALGERAVTLRELARNLDFAFQGASTGAIPALVDQVLVTEVNHVRAFESAVVYLLGAAEGKFPVRAAADELLGDQERTELLANGWFIAAASARRQQFERYRVYMALTRAKRQLVLSYALQGDDGKAKLPALLLRKLARDFSGLETESWNGESTGTEQEGLAYCRSIASAAEKLGQVVCGQASPAALPYFWQSVYLLFARGIWPQSVLAPYLQGLLHTARSQTLPAPIAKALYGERLTDSFSRLERFAACPFAYFVEYGLRARERKFARWDVRQQGNLLHQVLEKVQLRLLDGPTPWNALTDEQVDELTKQVFTEELGQFEAGILLQGGRNRLLARQLLRTLARAVRTLTEHARRSRFVPVKLEAEFHYEDPAGRFLLTGRMDRVDLADGGGTSWFRIIDFKSSEHVVDLAKIYHGLSLQLLLYASASEDMSTELFGKTARFAGMFYFPVRDPVASLDMGTAEQTAAIALRKAARMNGLFFADAGAVRLFDQNSASGASDLVPTLLKKDGSFRTDAFVVDERAWERLKALGYRHVAQLSQRANTGDIRILPYKLGKETPCPYCQLKSACAFEACYDYPSYRRLQAVSRKTALEWLANQAGEEDAR